MSGKSNLAVAPDVDPVNPAQYLFESPEEYVAFMENLAFGVAAAVKASLSGRSANENWVRPEEANGEVPTGLTEAHFDRFGKMSALDARAVTADILSKLSEMSIPGYQNVRVVNVQPGDHKVDLNSVNVYFSFGDEGPTSRHTKPPVSERADLDSNTRESA